MVWTSTPRRQDKLEPAKAVDQMTLAEATAAFNETTRNLHRESIIANPAAQVGDAPVLARAKALRRRIVELEANQEAASETT